MIINDYGGGVSSAAEHQSADRGRLAAFDGHTVAVILPGASGATHSGRTVLRGRAVYVHDDCVGNALRIELADDQLGAPVLILSESEWEGRIIPDFHHGCDFSLVVG